MKITEITIDEAVGKPFAHDLTKIDAKTGSKGARFKKGQIVTSDDLPILRSMGKEHLSILELDDDEVHEDDAALAMCEAVKGKNLSASGPSEGRITLASDVFGLVCYDAEMVHAVNEDPDWVLATIAPHRPVNVGQPVAGFRIRPLAIERERVDRAVAAASKIDVHPFVHMNVGLVTTGREIATGMIDDASRSRIEEKVRAFGGTLIGQELSTDDTDAITGAIRRFLDAKADIVICTGGMSVDPDDRTPGAIRAAADRIAFQGTPILPGAMLMMGWHKDAALIGTPACVVHDERTALDSVLPFLFARRDPTPYIRRWGVGGLCEHCKPCRWPSCAFSSNS